MLTIDMHTKTNTHIHHTNHTDQIPQLHVEIRLPFRSIYYSPNYDYFFNKVLFLKRPRIVKIALVERVITIRNVSTSGNKKSVRVEICSGLFILILI